MSVVAHFRFLPLCSLWLQKHEQAQSLFLFAYFFTYSLTHSLTHSLTLSPIHPFTHHNAHSLPPLPLPHTLPHTLTALTPSLHNSDFIIPPHSLPHCTTRSPHCHKWSLLGLPYTSLHPLELHWSLPWSLCGAMVRSDVHTIRHSLPILPMWYHSNSTLKLLTHRPTPILTNQSHYIELF